MADAPERCNNRGRMAPACGKNGEQNQIHRRQRDPDGVAQNAVVVVVVARLPHAVTEGEQVEQEHGPCKKAMSLPVHARNDSLTALSGQPGFFAPGGGAFYT